MNNQINLLEYAIKIQQDLDSCKHSEFAKLFVESKMQCFNLFHKGLINSNYHGVNFFKNIIKYWNKPELYCDDPKNIYEYNFVKLLKQNK
jgi:hypothetical protein